MDFPGDLRERYEPQAELGRGGMGIVFRALHRQLNRLVAVKILASEADANQDLRKRFTDEGRLAAKVRHPNVATVIESGETAEGYLFVVYEFVDGEDLEASLLANGPFSAKEAATFGVAILGGLEAIHQAGILHHDIKPANILIARSGEPKIADFGMAREQFSLAVRTRTGVVLGTPEFVAPEMVMGGKASVATDIYATGVLLYQLVTGQPPFTGQSVSALFASHMDSKPPDPVHEAIDLPRSLADIILMALEKKPDWRPRSASEFKKYLEQFLQDPAQPFRRPNRGQPPDDTVTPISRASGRGAPSYPGRTTVRPATGKEPRTLPFFAGLAAAGLIIGAGCAIAVHVHRANKQQFVNIPSGARLELESTTLLSDELILHIRSEGGGILTTNTFSIIPPSRYPFDVPVDKLPAGARSDLPPLTVTAADVASGLISQMNRIKPERRNVVMAPVHRPLWLTGRNPVRGQAKLPEPLARAMDHMVKIAMALKYHARPVLAGSLVPHLRSKLIENINGVEDFSMLSRFLDVPVIPDLSGIYPPRCRPATSADLPAGPSWKARLDLPFKASNPDRQIVLEARYDLAGQQREVAFVFANKFALELRGSVELPAPTANEIAYIAISPPPHAPVSVRVHLKRVTLRLFDPSDSALKGYALHTFDPSLLDPGKNEFTIDGVSATGPMMDVKNLTEFKQIVVGFTTESALKAALKPSTPGR